MAPLPHRHGLAPARVHAPEQGRWATVLEFLADQLGPRVDTGQIRCWFQAGNVAGPDGPLSEDAAYRPGSYVWFHRDLPDETPVPFGIEIVYRDESIVVIDKPHFLATIPRGNHVRESALVRLRRDLELPDLVPAHRLDRVTAGLVLFVVLPEHRGAYQQLFARRQVLKTYEALAGLNPDITFPRTVRSRIEKQRFEVRAAEVPGEPNSESLIEVAEVRREHARYRLTPRTGRTHQLRLHMNSLGTPILGDDLYPVVTDRAPDDFSRPLQLLAAGLAFTDPLTGIARHFQTRRELAWPY